MRSKRPTPAGPRGRGALSDPPARFEPYQRTREPVDGPDTAAQVGPWVEREGYPFPILIDRETQVLTRFNPRGDIPYYVVLDASGKVLKDHQGYMTGDMEELQRFLDGVLPPA